MWAELLRAVLMCSGWALRCNGAFDTEFKARQGISAIHSGEGKSEPTAPIRIASFIDKLNQLALWTATEKMTHLFSVEAKAECWAFPSSHQFLSPTSVLSECCNGKAQQRERKAAYPALPSRRKTYQWEHPPKSESDGSPWQYGQDHLMRWAQTQNRVFQCRQTLGLVSRSRIQTTVL